MASRARPPEHDDPGRCARRCGDRRRSARRTRSLPRGRLCGARPVVPARRDDWTRGRAAHRVGGLRAVGSALAPPAAWTLGSAPRGGRYVDRDRRHALGQHGSATRARRRRGDLGPARPAFAPGSDLGRPRRLGTRRVLPLAHAARVGPARRGAAGGGRLRPRRRACTGDGGAHARRGHGGPLPRLRRRLRRSRRCCSGVAVARIAAGSLGFRVQCRGLHRRAPDLRAHQQDRQTNAGRSLPGRGHAAMPHRARGLAGSPGTMNTCPGREHE